jgi:hypothetical protein
MCKLQKMILYFTNLSSTHAVNRTENKTRIMKMTSLDGEYRLLGRTPVDKANVFVQYGQGTTRTVNVTGGPGIQESEFIDGLRFSIEADKPLIMNVEIKSLTQNTALPAFMQSLCKSLLFLNLYCFILIQ